MQCRDRQRQSKACSTLSRNNSRVRSKSTHLSLSVLEKSLQQAFPRLILIKVAIGVCWGLSLQLPQHQPGSAWSNIWKLCCQAWLFRCPGNSCRTDTQSCAQSGWPQNTLAVYWPQFPMWGTDGATDASWDPRFLDCLHLPRRRREAWSAAPAVCCSCGPQQPPLAGPSPSSFSSPLMPAFPLLGAETCLCRRGRASDAPALGFVPSALLLDTQRPPVILLHWPGLQAFLLRLVFCREITSSHLSPARNGNFVLSSVPRNSTRLSSTVACVPWLAHIDLLKSQ